ncbi:MAG: M15 family metallopeptidase [Cyanobacteria bacterium SIG26]|nr:M15 family metallopeptidase [Cyanobacteria bacterium SIG26]
MVTWLTNSFNMCTNWFSHSFGCNTGPYWGNAQQFGTYTHRNWFSSLTNSLTHQRFSWNIYNAQYNTGPTMSPLLAQFYSTPIRQNSFNFNNPFTTRQFSIPSFSQYLSNTSFEQLLNPAGSKSTWNSMGLNLSNSGNSTTASNNYSSQSVSTPCSTQNIRSKNAPYNGYDRSPHSAVNSNVHKYTKYGNNKHIEQLEPDFQLKIMKIIDYAKQHGYDFKIISSFRTRSHQDSLRKKYAHQKGRAAKVSPHMFGKAIDFQVLKNGRKCSAGYDLVGKYAESLGIRWGARFRTCKERWHFDYNWV